MFWTEIYVQHPFSVCDLFEVCKALSRKAVFVWVRPTETQWCLYICSSLHLLFTIYALHYLVDIGLLKILKSEYAAADQQRLWSDYTCKKLIWFFADYICCRNAYFWWHEFSVDDKSDIFLLWLPKDILHLIPSLLFGKLQCSHSEKLRTRTLNDLIYLKINMLWLPNSNLSWNQAYFSVFLQCKNLH